MLRCIPELGRFRASLSPGRNVMAVPFDQLPGMIWFDGKLDSRTGSEDPRADAWPALRELRCSRASAPMAATIFKSTEHSERLKNSAQDSGFRNSLFGRRDRRRQAAGDRQERHDRRLCAPDRVARIGAARRVGAEQRHSSRDRDLAMAELFRSRAAAEGHQARPRRISPARSAHLALSGEGRRPLHDLHDLQASRRAARLCRRDDARLGRAASPNAPAPISSSSRTARSTRRPPIASSTASRAAP